MVQCKIQWIDEQGNPTPDQNEAIGIVWMPARVYQGRQFINGHVAVPESAKYPICAEHARQLSNRGMHIWSFEALDPQSIA